MRSIAREWTERPAFPLPDSRSGRAPGPPLFGPGPADGPLTEGERRALAADLAAGEPVLAQLRGAEFDRRALWLVTPTRLLLVEWARVRHETTAVPRDDSVVLDLEVEPTAGDDGRVTLWLAHAGGMRALHGVPASAAIRFVATAVRRRPGTVR